MQRKTRSILWILLWNYVSFRTQFRLLYTIFNISHFIHNILNSNLGHYQGSLSAKGLVALRNNKYKYQEWKVFFMLWNKSELWTQKTIVNRLETMKFKGIVLDITTLNHAESCLGNNIEVTFLYGVLLL